MPRLVLKDFRGGENSRDAVNLLKPNQGQGSENVWAYNQALCKRPGSTTQVLTIDTLSPIPEQLKPTQMAATNLMRLAFLGRVAAHSQRYLGYSDNGADFYWAGYVVGTCSTAGASTTVTGAGGPLWQTHAKVGDYFIPAGGAPNRITAINSDTEIVVTSAVTLAGGTAYKILPAIAQGSPAAMVLFDVSAAQNLFIFDGVRVLRYDGTNIYTAAGTPPAGKIAIAHKGYIFVLRHNDTDVRWCAYLDGTSWPAANYQAVGTVGDPVRGACVFNDALIIWTRSRMFRLNGDVFDPANPSYTLEQIAVPSDFNFVFSRTAVVHGGILKFLTTDGWYGYVGGGTIEKISPLIQTDVDGLRRLAYAPEAMQDSAVAIVYKDDMWVSVPDDAEVPGQTLNTIYVQDQDGAWWRWPSAAYVAAGEYSDFALVKFGAAGAYKLMAGNVGTNKISTLDTGSSEDSAKISASWPSMEFVFPADVEMIELEVTMKKQVAGNLTVSFSIDRATYVDKTCDMTAGVGTVIRKVVPVGRVGKSIRLKVANAVLAQGFEVYEMALLWEPSEGRRA